MSYGHSANNSMDTKPNQPTANQGSAVDVSSGPLLGRFFTGSDGGWYEVVQEWKYRVKLRRRSCGKPAHIVEWKESIVAPAWREHTLPKSIRKGDVMICNGERCEITSFHSLGNLGPFLGVTAAWGFENRTHENLIRFGSARQLMSEGLRLPFDGELSA